jgi:hypothetical protein
MGLHQPRGPLRSCRRRRGQPPIRDERSDTIIADRGAGGNDVRYRTPSDRDTHLLPAFDSSQRLAQRALQGADTDLTHVVTIAPMWSSPVGRHVARHVAHAVRGGRPSAKTPAAGASVIRARAPGGSPPRPPRTPTAAAGSRAVSGKPKETGTTSQAQGPRERSPSGNRGLVQSGRGRAGHGPGDRHRDHLVTDDLRVQEVFV